MKDHGRKTRYTDSEGEFILMGHFILASGDTENEMVLVFNIFRMGKKNKIHGFGRRIHPDGSFYSGKWRYG